MAYDYSPDEICEGFARRFEGSVPGFANWHELIFLFRNGTARNNAQALKAWVEDIVQHLLAAGVAVHEVFGFVEKKLDAEMQAVANPRAIIRSVTTCSRSVALQTCYIHRSGMKAMANKTGNLRLEQVTQVAEALRIRGVEPSLRAVRAELGEHGSFSTLGPLLARWRQEREAQAQTPLSDALLMQLRDEVQDRVVAQTAKLQATVAAVQQDLADALADNERLNGKLDECARSAGKADAAREAATAREAFTADRVTSLETELAQMRVAAAEMMRDLTEADLRRQAAEEAALSTAQNLQRVEGELSTARARIEQLLEAQSVLTTKVAAMDTDVATTKTKLTIAEKALAETASRATDVNQLYDHVLDELRQRIEVERQSREVTQVKLLELLSRQTQPQAKQRHGFTKPVRGRGAEHGDS